MMIAKMKKQQEPLSIMEALEKKDSGIDDLESVDLDAIDDQSKI
jgi:hypothetical protein